MGNKYQHLIHIWWRKRRHTDLCLNEVRPWEKQSRESYETLHTMYNAHKRRGGSGRCFRPSLVRRSKNKEPVFGPYEYYIQRF